LTQVVVNGFLELILEKIKKIQCGTHEMVFSTASNIRVITLTPRRGVEGGASLLGDFRVTVCLTPPQMNDFCDLLGTPESECTSFKNSVC
jgi:hypothetical protein